MSQMPSAARPTATAQQQEQAARRVRELREGARLIGLLASAGAGRHSDGDEPDEDVDDARSPRSLPGRARASSCCSWRFAPLASLMCSSGSA